MEASEAVELAARDIDLVVLNSVVQYFPGIDHLSRIVSRALALLPEGGRIFLGDIRDLRLAEIFRLAIARQLLADNADDARVLAIATELVSAERELLVHPDFFARMLDREQALSHVDIRLKRGRSRNEMNAFRYDVVIERGAPRAQSVAEVRRWGTEMADIQSLRATLRGDAPDSLRINGVPNGRLAAGADPEDLYLAGDDAGYHTVVTWSPTSLTDVDVVYRRLPCAELVSAYRPAVLASTVANTPA